MKNVYPKLLLLTLFIGIFSVPARAESDVNLKPLLHGLISMGNITFYRHDNGVPDNSLKYIYAKPGILDGVVLNFTWNQLQPKADEFTTEAIDRALANVRAYNKIHPNTPLAVRLRVYAGPNAPSWAKTLSGPAVNIQYRGESLTIGRFWSLPYIKAWRNLQEQLAKKYDDEPLIRAVAMTSCSSVTSEPFVFPGGSVTLKNMHKAGFTDGKYRQCLVQATTDYIVWQNTRIEYPFNPYRLSDSGEPHSAENFTLSIMRKWRKVSGPIAVVSNHKLQVPMSRRQTRLYDAIKKIGPPIELQVNGPNTPNLDGAFKYGIALGATAIEIWPETFVSLPPQKLKQWSNAIKNN